MEIECICINDLNKPDEILIENWVKKDEKYHIIHVFKQMNNEQLGIQGVLLKEISTKSEKYNCYRLDRFAFKKEDFYKLIELIKLCAELDYVNIVKLLEQEELEIIET